MFNQTFSFESAADIVAWQFNREFYCIIDHDAEGSCVGLLFGPGDLLFIGLDEPAQQKLKLLLHIFIEEFNRSTLQDKSVLLPFVLLLFSLKPSPRWYYLNKLIVSGSSMCKSINISFSGYIKLIIFSFFPVSVVSYKWSSFSRLFTTFSSSSLIFTWSSLLAFNFVYNLSSLVLYSDFISRKSVGSICLDESSLLFVVTKTIYRIQRDDFQSVAWKRILWNG